LSVCRGEGQLAAGKTGSEHVELSVSLDGRDEPQVFYATVDGTSAAGSLIDECLEDSNDAAIAGVTCPIVPLVPDYEGKDKPRKNLELLRRQPPAA